jgi:hypothetical protein
MVMSFRTKVTTLAAAMVSLAFAGPLLAHHSLRMIEISTPIWVKGTVVSYEPVDPHTMIELDIGGEDGRWTVEGPILGRLGRYGLLGKDFLKPGDSIEVCGFAPKQELRDSFASRRLEQFMHGHLLVLSNGDMQLWGPYGKLDNCVRPGDDRDSWLDFLNNPMARQIWCGPVQTATPLSPLSSRGLVEEINRQMTTPCD